MTFQTAVKKHFSSELAEQLRMKKDPKKGNTIDFDNVESQRIIRQALIDTLNDAGYQVLEMIIESAWKI
jgi:hypothetical protein